MDPVLWFVTPVWRRFYLTKLCLTQRRRMMDRLPFKAHCVVIGDDEELLTFAQELDFDVIERGNDYVGLKWNAGYVHAYEAGATHCMPIGSDSWLHESTFENWPEWEAKQGYTTVGLSSFSPDGMERCDLAIKYPAGFGVGMVYPSWATYAQRLKYQACEPKKNRGCDNSTWARVGRGRVQIRDVETPLYSYINFHSTEESITDYRLLKSGHRRVRGWEGEDTIKPLEELYDADLVDDLRRMYALRSLGVFLTGKHPQWVDRFGKRARRYPAIDGRSPTGGLRSQGVANRYPNVGLRPRSAAKDEFDAREYAVIADRQRRKAQGKTLTRDEEMSLRFAAVRGF